jgi:hypothetical protein
MGVRTRVVVYGNSLNLAGIAASLKADARLEVICINPHAPNARQSLNELNPAVIAFDLSETNPDLDIILLRDQPGLQLIGIDACSDKLLVLSSHSSQAHSVADLISVIQPIDLPVHTRAKPGHHPDG